MGSIHELISTFENEQKTAVFTALSDYLHLSHFTDVSLICQHQAWLPDGYSRIFRSYVFGPSGFWTMAPLRCKIGSLPFVGFCPHALHPGAIRKGRDPILPFGNLAWDCPQPDFVIIMAFFAKGGYGGGSWHCIMRVLAPKIGAGPGSAET